MTLLSRREEVRALRLARSGRRGVSMLKRLVDKIRARVIAFAQAQPEVHERVTGRRTRILGVDAHVEAAGFGRLLAPRHAEVAIYDYDRDVLVSVIVNLKKQSVERVTDLPGRQPPPSRDEIREATALVRATAGKGKVSRTGRLRPVVLPAREATTKGHSAYGHRVFEVRFLGKGGRLSTPILVDLSRCVCIAEKGG